MLELFFWFVFGILGGWTAALVAEPLAAPQRVAWSMLVGGVGAAVGGGIGQVLSHHPLLDGFNAGSILLAVLFASALASMFNFFIRKRRH